MNTTDPSQPTPTIRRKLMYSSLLQVASKMASDVVMQEVEMLLKTPLPTGKNRRERKILEKTFYKETEQRALRLKDSYDYFHKRVDYLVEGIVKDLDDKAKKQFMDFTTVVLKIAQGVEKAKDLKEISFLIESYNRGLLDEMLKKLGEPA